MQKKILTSTVMILCFLFIPLIAYSFDAKEYVDGMNERYGSSQTAQVDDAPRTFEEWEKEKQQAAEWLAEKRANDALNAQQEESKQQQKSNLYRNEEYKFRIKFPEGWTIEDGDGEHVVKKASKDGSSVMVLVLDFPVAEIENEVGNLMTQEEIDDTVNNLNFDDYTEEELYEFLDFQIEASEANFPDSNILERGIGYLDNHKAIYYTTEVTYRVLGVKSKGILTFYSILHKGKLYQVGGGYSMDPIDEEYSKPQIEASIASFVFEDWNSENFSEKNRNVVNNDESNLFGLDINDLQDITIEESAKSFFGGLVLISMLLAGRMVYGVYVKYFGTKLRNKKTINNAILSSKFRRLLNYSIDFFLVIKPVDGLVMYLFLSFFAKEISYYSYFLFNLPLVFIVFIFYYTFFEGVFGRTVGKIFTKTKVVSQDGSRAKFGQVFIRTLIRLIPFEAFSFLGKDPLGWHDRWSKTMVSNVGYEKLVLGRFCKLCGVKIAGNGNLCNGCKKM
jgi:uncharacterized RDD family membrane protein YckC